MFPSCAKGCRPRKVSFCEGSPCPHVLGPLWQWRAEGHCPSEGLVTQLDRGTDFAEALPVPALIFSLFLSERQPQLSNFNFIHTAAITPSGSRRMNTNGPLDCFKCRSEPGTCLHFVRSCSITLRFVECPPNGSLLVPSSDPGVCVRAEESANATERELATSL